MRTISILAICLTLTHVAYSWPPDYPAGSLTFGGSESGILIENFYDLTCSNCKLDWPVFKTFMNMSVSEFGGKKVKDIVKIKFSFFPLPYHHFSFPVHKLVPILNDKCIQNPDNCKLL
jgi:hypothetical protein